MADSTTVKQSESKFRAPSPGNKVALCVDVLNFGECVSDVPGKPKSLSPKLGLVFRTGEINEHNGECIDVVAEYGAFMSAKAKLRVLLEGWRGKPFTEEQVQAGIPLDKMCGKYVLLNVGNKTSPTSGRTYAIVLSASPVPKEMTIPTFTAYERPKYLVDRKEAYAKAASLYRAEIGVDEDGNPLSRHHESEAASGDEDDMFAWAVAGALPKRVRSSEHGGTGLVGKDEVKKALDLDDDDLPF